MTEARGALDPLLYELAQTLLAEGHRLAGIVQINSDRPGTERCDMDALVLPDGPAIRISQSLGPAARGCRLDPEGLETAVAAAHSGLDTGVGLLIVNKFGKQEAAGRGFRPVIADALDRGTDVLVGVNALNLEALREFAGELASPVPAELDALRAWVCKRNDAASIKS